MWSTKIPSKFLQPDFKNKLYVECYDTLFSGTGAFYSNANSHNITKEEYPNVYCLFVYLI